MTDVGSVSKYCSPLKAETAWTVQVTNFQRVGSQEHKDTFGSERNKSCYLPCEVGSVFGTRSSGSSTLNWAMEGGGAPTAIRNRDISNGNKSKHWFKWPWNWVKLEYRRWLYCCPLSGYVASVGCWFLMVWGMMFPSLALLNSDLRAVDQRSWNLFSRVAEVYL